MFLLLLLKICTTPITLKNGIVFEFSKDEIINAFISDNSTNLIKISMKLNSSLTKQATLLTDLQNKNNICKEKNSQITNELNLLKNEVSDGAKVMNEFQNSNSRQKKLEEQINLMEQSTNEYISMMNAEFFPEVISALNQINLINQKLKNKVVEIEKLEGEKEMVKFKLEREKSCLDRFKEDEEIRKKYETTEINIKDLNEKYEKFLPDLINSRNLLEQENAKLSELNEKIENLNNFFNFLEKNEISKKIEEFNEKHENLKIFFENNEINRNLNSFFENNEINRNLNSSVINKINDKNLNKDISLLISIKKNEKNSREMLVLVTERIIVKLFSELKKSDQKLKNLEKLKIEMHEKLKINLEEIEMIKNESIEVKSGINRCLKEIKEFENLNKKELEKEIEITNKLNGNLTVLEIKKSEYQIKLKEAKRTIRLRTLLILILAFYSIALLIYLMRFTK